MVISRKVPAKITFILGGSAVKSPEGGWHTTDFSEGDIFGILGDYVRPKAAAVLFRAKKINHIVVLGGKGQLSNKPGAPYISEVIRDELIDDGVPQDRIETERKSGNSLEQLMACATIVKKRKWNPGDVGLLSNDYHLPRLQAMMETFESLKILRDCELISAEAVLMEYQSEEWREIINTAYRSKSMKLRMVLEKKGVEDIQSGKYRIP